MAEALSSSKLRAKAPGPSAVAHAAMPYSLLATVGTAMALIPGELPSGTAGVGWSSRMIVPQTVPSAAWATASPASRHATATRGKAQGASSAPPASCTGLPAWVPLSRRRTGR